MVINIKSGTGAKTEAQRERERLARQRTDTTEERRIEQRKQDLPFTKPKPITPEIPTEIADIGKTQALRQAAADKKYAAELVKYEADLAEYKDALQKYEVAVEHREKYDSTLKDLESYKVATGEYDLVKAIEGKVPEDTLVWLFGKDAITSAKNAIAEYNTAVSQAQAKYEAELKEYQQAEQQYQRLLSKVEPYKTKDGYDVVKAVQAGVADDTLATLFGADAVKETKQKIVEYETANAQNVKAYDDYQKFLTKASPYKTEGGYDIIRMLQGGFTTTELIKYGFDEGYVKSAKNIKLRLDLLKPYSLWEGGYDLTKIIQDERTGKLPTGISVDLFGLNTVQDARHLLDRSGEEVFADMKKQGVIPSNAVYDSYDKDTGKVSYHLPDTRSGEKIFEELKSKGDIPANAEYRGYDKATGEISYAVPTPAGEKTVTEDTQTTPTETTQQVIGGNVQEAFAVGAIAIPTTLGPTVSALAFSPDPITKIVLATLVAGTLATVAGRQLGEWIRRKIDESKVAQSASAAITPSDVIVEDTGGADAYTVSQIQAAIAAIGSVNVNMAQYTTEQLKSSGISLRLPAKAVDKAPPVTSVSGIVYEQRKPPTMETPLESPRRFDTTLPYEKLAAMDLTFPLEQYALQIPGIPSTPIREQVTMTKIPYIADPLARGKLKNLMTSAIAAGNSLRALGSVAVKERVITRAEYDDLMRQVGEYLRQGRVVKGKAILDNIAKNADSPSISRSYRLAYEDYLRKKAILDNARKTYVASLKPQPVKGVGIGEGAAGASGILLIVNALTNALKKGQTVNQALKTITPVIHDVAKTLGFTKANIAVYESAVQNMVRQAVDAKLANPTITQTELTTKLDSITKQAIQTATATATLTATQAASATAALTQTASATATMAATLPPIAIPPIGTSDGRRKKYPKGSVAWKQGFIYKLIYPPYGENDIIHSTKPFAGVKTLDGAKSAYKTIVKLGGKVPKVIKQDMGIMDITIKTPKEGKPSLSFFRDIKQETWHSARRRRKTRPKRSNRPMSISASVGKY